VTVLYIIYKTIHILGVTALLGAGLRAAFFMWRANRTGDVSAIAAAARKSVRAHWLFTMPAAIIQPLSGILLLSETGYGFDDAWVKLSLALYALALASWLPAIWLQARIRDMALSAIGNGHALPPLCRRHMRIWFGLGWLALLSVIAIVTLMVQRPAL